MASAMTALNELLRNGGVSAAMIAQALATVATNASVQSWIVSVSAKKRKTLLYLISRISCTMVCKFYKVGQVAPFMHVVGK